MNRIPFNRPWVPESAYDYFREAVANMHLSGDGPFTRRCHAFFEEQVGAKRALLTTSCTHALEMAALLLELHAGDEVIVPSFTFVSTANAFVLRGATPIFADVRSDTLNIDEAALPGLVTPRTRAVVPVHYGGVGCEMEPILRLARAHGLAVIEDNAHGLFGRLNGRPLGSFGALAAQSFHETKNVSCGEGGALLINDAAFAGRAEILREKGTDRSRFFRGQVDKYTWVDVGSSFLPADLLAAFLWSQLERWRDVQEKRRQVWMRYHHTLHDWAAENQVRQPVVPPHCEQAWHLYYLILPDLAQRQAFLTHLRGRGVAAAFHYQPLHLSPMGLRHGGRPGACPVTEAAADRLVRLPFYYDLTAEDQARVIEAVCAFKVARAAVPYDDPFALPLARPRAA